MLAGPRFESLPLDLAPPALQSAPPVLHLPSLALHFGSACAPVGSVCGSIWLRRRSIGLGRSCSAPRRGNCYFQPL